jgi:hypothetical protein
VEALSVACLGEVLKGGNRRHMRTFLNKTIDQVQVHCNDFWREYERVIDRLVFTLDVWTAPMKLWFKFTASPKVENTLRPSTQTTRHR